MITLHQPASLNQAGAAARKIQNTDMTRMPVQVYILSGYQAFFRPFQS